MEECHRLAVSRRSSAGRSRTIPQAVTGDAPVPEAPLLLHKPFSHGCPLELNKPTNHLPSFSFRQESPPGHSHTVKINVM